MAARRRNADRRNWPKNLYKNSAGAFWFRNPNTGKTYGLGKDLRVAIAQARAANAEIEHQRGDVGLVERMSQTDMSLYAWCDEYEQVYLKRGNAPGTLSNVKSALRAIKAAPFSKKLVHDVISPEINLWIKSVTANISSSRAARLRSRIHDVFNEAIAEGLIAVGKNPVSAIRKPTQEVTRQRLTLDDFMAIISEARKDPGMVWAARAFTLALLTGQRRDDVKRMEFPHVKDGFLWVEQGKSQGTTKIKIPTSIGLKSIGLTIDDVIRECRDSIASKHIIHYVRHRGTTKPGHSPTLRSFSDAFAVCRDAAKIQVEDGKSPPTFHEIRSLSARLYGDEFGAEFAQALLGHKNAQMTALYRDSRGREWVEVKALNV